MAPHLAAVLAGVLALGALSACGSVEQTGDTSLATTSASPTGTGGEHPTVRVRGTVSEGVEPGCKVLTSKGVLYLLISRERTLVTGQQVELEGTVQPALITTCQQGTPLVVKRVLSP